MRGKLVTLGTALVMALPLSAKSQNNDPSRIAGGIVAGANALSVPASSQSGSLTQDQVNQIRTYLMLKLNDYDSGKYVAPAYHVAYSERPAETVICFLANLKNGFGAYTGYHATIVVLQPEYPDDPVEMTTFGGPCPGPEPADPKDYSSELFPKSQIIPNAN